MTIRRELYGLGCALSVLTMGFPAAAQDKYPDHPVKVIVAAPDGYTRMVSPASFLTTNKSIFKELPYDPEADFAPSPSWRISPWCWW